MARGSALPRALALGAALCVGLRATAFVSAAVQGSSAAAPSLGVAQHAAPAAAGQGKSLRAETVAAGESSRFSGATLLPALLLSARSMVSVGAAVNNALVARQAKAPISEYGAPSGVRNFQEMTLGFTSDIAKNNLGESFYRPWVPYVTTIFLFIFTANRGSHLSNTSCLTQGFFNSGE